MPNIDLRKLLNQSLVANANAPREAGAANENLRAPPREDGEPANAPHEELISSTPVDSATRAALPPARVDGRAQPSKHAGPKPSTLRALRPRRRT